MLISFSGLSSGQGFRNEPSAPSERERERACDVDGIVVFIGEMDEASSGIFVRLVIKNDRAQTVLPGCGYFFCKIAYRG